MALMRSLNNSNKDALSGNAGHGDADGITQPNKDARCTGTEDFFQSSSNFKSADAATLTEARALTALRAAREENTRKRAAVSQGVHCMHFRRITTQQSRTPPPPPDRPTDRSIGRSIVRSSIRRPRRVPSTARDAPPPRGRRSSMYTQKYTASPRARVSPVPSSRARRTRLHPPGRPDRVSPSRIAPASRLGRASVGRASSSSSPRVHRFPSTDSERTNAIVIASSVHVPRGASAERVAVGARANPCEVRAITIVARVELCGVGRRGSRRADRSRRSDLGVIHNNRYTGDRGRGMRVDGA